MSRKLERSLAVSIIDLSSGHHWVSGSPQLELPPCQPTFACPVVPAPHPLPSCQTPGWPPLSSLKPGPPLCPLHLVPSHLLQDSLLSLITFCSQKKKKMSMIVPTRKQPCSISPSQNQAQANLSAAISPANCIPVLLLPWQWESLKNLSVWLSSSSPLPKPTPISTPSSIMLQTVLKAAGVCHVANSWVNSQQGYF